MALELVGQALYVYVNKILESSYRKPIIITLISHSCFMSILDQLCSIPHHLHCFSTSSSSREPDPLSILSLKHLWSSQLTKGKYGDLLSDTWIWLTCDVHDFSHFLGHIKSRVCLSIVHLSIYPFVHPSIHRDLLQGIGSQVPRSAVSKLGTQESRCCMFQSGGQQT